MGKEETEEELNEKKRVASYVRVSTAEQETDLQESELSKYRAEWCPVKAVLYISLALLLSVTLEAQTKELRIVGNMKSQLSGLVFGQVSCDRFGHIYARTYDRQ
jgi:predicted site-specific integrase-resolvase